MLICRHGFAVRGFVDELFLPFPVASSNCCYKDGFALFLVNHSFEAVGPR
jgi:hypothetical protein